MHTNLRAWWRDHWMEVSLGYYFIGLSVVGAVGFCDPSLAMDQAIGIGTLVYAVGMSAGGLAALISLILGSRRSVSVMVVVLNLLTVVHGALLIAAGSAGLQSGIRLVIAPFGALVLAYLWSQQTTLRRDEVRRHIEAVTEDGARD